VPLVWGQRPEPPAGGHRCWPAVIPRVSAPIWGDPPLSWFSCPCSLFLPWRPYSTCFPSPTPSPPHPPLTRSGLPSPSPPQALPSSATRSPGTRTPACPPPGPGHLVPSPPREGATRQPRSPLGLPGPIWRICKNLCSWSPQPDAREALGGKDQQLGPRKLPHPTMVRSQPRSGEE